MRQVLALLAILPWGADAAASLKPADLPREIIVAVERAIPGIMIQGVEKKERAGRHYYDVEGLRTDGSEVELDLLQTPRGWEVVEIQRDIVWTAVPKNARAMAIPALKGITPVRVIESRQVDGRIVYEIFRPGAPDKPELEVIVDRGKPTLLTEAWPH